VAWFYGESDEVSGAPRILADLPDDGEVISRKTVRKGDAEARFDVFALRDGARSRTSSTNDAYPADAAKRAWCQGC
jgi:putative transposase